MLLQRRGLAPGPTWHSQLLVTRVPGLLMPLSVFCGHRTHIRTAARKGQPKLHLLLPPQSRACVAGEEGKLWAVPALPMLTQRRGQKRLASLGSPRLRTKARKESTVNCYLPGGPQRPAVARSSERAQKHTGPPRWQPVIPAASPALCDSALTARGLRCEAMEDTGLFCAASVLDDPLQRSVTLSRHHPAPRICK